jgi:HAD superfamily hydrolase (TIGR01490 family)
MAADLSHAASCPPSDRAVVLFDFDGTLIPWDTQKLFCHYVLKRHPLRRCFLLAYLPLLPFGGILGAEGLKRVFLSFLWRMKEAEVRELARDFAEESLAPQIWLEMRALLEKHQACGDLTILISASPEPYVEEIGRILGFDLALGTRIDFPPDGLPLFPDLINNKGRRKVERLREVLDESYFSGGQLRHAHGYTDSRADLPMLTLCQQATVVNPSPRLQELAVEKGWLITRQPRPWKGKLHRCWLRLKYVTGC